MIHLIQIGKGFPRNPKMRLPRMEEQNPRTLNQYRLSLNLYLCLSLLSQFLHL